MAASSQSSKLLKRYFLTYRGVKLPLALGEEVDTEGVATLVAEIVEDAIKWEEAAPSSSRS